MLCYESCRCGVAALDAGDCGRGRVCNVAPPLRVSTVQTNMLGVQCSGVCSCSAVCMDVCVCSTLISVSGN
jgi:hypothetical protein